MKWIVLAAVMLAGCQDELRSASYFATHPEAAKQVIEACRSASQRGPECANARTGITAGAAASRLDLFKKSAQ